MRSRRLRPGTCPTPVLSYATENPPTNVLGLSGAVFADLMMQFFGLGSLLALLPVLAWSFALIGGRRLHRIPARIAAWLVGRWWRPLPWVVFPRRRPGPCRAAPRRSRDLILRFRRCFIGAYPTSTFAMVLGAILALPPAWLLLFAAGIVGKAAGKLRRGYRADEAVTEGQGSCWDRWTRTKKRKIRVSFALSRRLYAQLVSGPRPHAPALRHQIGRSPCA